MNDGREDPWLGLDVAARERALAIGLPSPGQHTWAHVEAPIMIPVASASDPRRSVPAVRLPGQPTVVLIDGIVTELPMAHAGMAISSLASLPGADQRLLAERWHAQLTTLHDVTECWSLQQPHHGLMVRVPAATCATRESASVPALQILLVSHGGDSGCRLVFELDEHAALDVVLVHFDLAPARSSVGIEVQVRRGARLNVDELQFAGHAGYTDQLHTHARIEQARDTSVQWTSCHQGGRLVRASLTSQLNEPGAHLRITNLAVLAQTRQAHLRTRVVHAQGHTSSTQLVKTVADDKAIASFDGVVTIAVGADGATAEQHHHNLLLSSSARVDTRPQLDIHADDVQAAHGATVGRPDPDELFYLRSRGLDPAQAQAVLMRGFAVEPILMMNNPHAQSLAKRSLLATLAGE